MTDDVAAVREMWQQLGLPGLVDVHTHFMPERVLSKVWDYFDLAEPFLGMPWPITYRWDEQQRLDRIRAYGVRSFTSMLYPHQPNMAAWLNSWSADFAGRTPDCLHTATFYPEPAAGAYVTEAVEAGARVFKAHVQVGDYDPRDAQLDPVWGTLQDAGTPIVVHCGSGPALPGPFTGPGPISEVLARFPRLRLIVAHLGVPEYAEFLDLAERYDEVRLDTTMNFTDFTESFSPFPADLRPRLVDLQNRILFGSDFPNIPYTYAHALESLVRLDLGDEWLRAVCHYNGAALFELPSAA